VETRRERSLIGVLKMLRKSAPSATGLARRLPGIVVALVATTLILRVVATAGPRTGQARL